MSHFRPFARPLLALALGSLATAAAAAPAVYEIDPMHTFPSFEADHMGLSTWRGKFNDSRGEITLDKAAGSGSLKVTVEVASIDFGLEAMNEKARGAELFDAAKYPQATYTGTLAEFRGGAPTKVNGELTLHGVTRPSSCASSGSGACRIRSTSATGAAPMPPRRSGATSSASMRARNTAST